MRLLILPLLLALVAPAAAQAAETVWQTIAPDVRMRLISAGGAVAGGEARLALEIDMPEATRTYWRIPGDAGLPTVLDLTGSRDVGAHRIEWPFPIREEKDGLLDYAYFGHTVLPVTVEVTGPDPEVEMAVTMGVCSDICVPAQARFQLRLDEASDEANELRIRQALAEVPIPWDDHPAAIGELRWLADRRVLAMQVDTPEVDMESIIVSTDDPAILFDMPQKSPQPDVVLLPIRGKSGNSSLVGMDIQITFMTDMGPFEIRRTVEDGSGEE